MYTEFAPGSDIDALHDALFQGTIAQLNNLHEMTAIVGFTPKLLVERLAPIEPVRIHEAEGDLAGRCAELQRDYANSGKAKELWKSLFEAIGLDPQTAMRDRLTLRFQPPRPPSGERPWARSTATVAFHRDTWGANLYAQVNWWAPVYPITAGRTFAFLPKLFARPLKNNSSEFDIVALMERTRGHGPPVRRRRDGAAASRTDRSVRRAIGHDLARRAHRIFEPTRACRRRQLHRSDPYLTGDSHTAAGGP